MATALNSTLAFAAEPARRASEARAITRLTVIRNIEHSKIPGVLSHSEAVMALAKEVKPGRLTPEQFFEFEALLMGEGGAR